MRTPCFAQNLLHWGTSPLLTCCPGPILLRPQCPRGGSSKAELHQEAPQINSYLPCQHWEEDQAPGALGQRKLENLLSTGSAISLSPKDCPPPPPPHRHTHPLSSALSERSQLLNKPSHPDSALLPMVTCLLPLCLGLYLPFPVLGKSSHSPSHPHLLPWKAQVERYIFTEQLYWHQPHWGGRRKDH